MTCDRYPTRTLERSYHYVDGYDCLVPVVKEDVAHLLGKAPGDSNKEKDEDESRGKLRIHYHVRCPMASRFPKAQK